MRKTAAAVAATLALTAALLVGPTPASADPVEDTTKVVCGTLGSPVCEVLNEVTALLKPLEPVLALAGPALGSVGELVNSLGKIDLAAGVPASELSGIASGLIDQLDALPAPVAGLLDAIGGRDLLTSTLNELLAAIDDLTPAPAPAPEPEGAGAPAPDPSAPGSPTPPAGGPGGSVGSTSSSGATGFGGSLSTGGTTAPTSSSSRVPNVPFGSSLNLDSMPLPELRLSSPSTAAAAPTSAEVELAERGATEVVLPAAQQAVVSDAMPDGNHPLTVAVAIGALLAAAALHVERVRRANAHVIPADA